MRQEVFGQKALRLDVLFLQLSGTLGLFSSTVLQSPADRDILCLHHPMANPWPRGLVSP